MIIQRVKNTIMYVLHRLYMVGSPIGPKLTTSIIGNRSEHEEKNDKR